MQRQSLGSPVSKLQVHGGPRNDTLLANDLPSTSIFAHADDDDQLHKATKPRRFSSASTSSSSPSFSHTNPDKLIHLIPLLTFLCFLVLFLVSHHPTQSDLAHVGGFKRNSNRIDSSEIIDDVNVVDEMRRGDDLAIRSGRSLQEIGDKRASLKSRYHRKIAGF